MTILDLLVQGGASRSWARRLVASGGVFVNETVVSSLQEPVPPSGVLRVGQSKQFVFMSTLLPGVYERETTIHEVPADAFTRWRDGAAEGK